MPVWLATVLLAVCARERQQVCENHDRVNVVDEVQPHVRVARLICAVACEYLAPELRKCTE